MNRSFLKHLFGFHVATGTFFQRRAHLVIRSLALVVAMAGAIGFARAADELPSQDQALARALENHPEIIAAKAQVALAEAGLFGKQKEVSRRVLAFYGSVKTQDAKIAQLKAALNQSNVKYDRKEVEAQLVEATVQRDQAEYELRSLIGAAPGTKEAKSPNAAASPARQAPQGAMVGNWKAVAERAIKISFTEVPLSELVNFLSDNTGMKFSVQRPAFEEAGLDLDMPISLSIKGVPLDAALQGFEDAYPQLQFVLRDYGVLLTTKDYAQDHGYMPALEIGKDAPSVIPR